MLVTGAGGLLGREVVHQLGERGHDAVACDRHALDVTDRACARDVILRSTPDAVLHCAAFTNVDAAEASPDEAFRVNAAGTEHVAAAAAAAAARFVYVSTDYVFDGQSDRPYRTSAPTGPLGIYGHSKLEGERAARRHADALIVRTSWVYGRKGANFASRLLSSAGAGSRIRAIADQRSIPTWVHDAADILIRLLEADVPAGIYHASNAGDATWYEFACEVVRCAGVDADVEPVSVTDLALPAPRPAYSVLDVSATESAVGPIRHWSDAVAAAVEAGR